MGMLVGFESARTGFMDAGAETFASDNIFTINNSSGGVMGANITNLNYTPTIVYAGDSPYRVSGKGVGAISCAFTAQDIPPDIIAKLTGIVKNAQGFYVVGKDTKAPNAALELTSHDSSGNAVHLALLKGIWSVPDKNPQTNQAQETDATDALTFTGLTRISDGLAYAEGYENPLTTPAFSQPAWDSFIFPVTGTTTTTTA